MIIRDVTVRHELGIHARPAAQIAKLASQFDSDVEIRMGDKRSNAKSIMGLMMLAAGSRAELEIVADGPDETEAADALAELISRGFNLAGTGGDP